MEEENEIAPTPITMCRTTGREAWVWIANAIQIALFVCVTSLGINYLTGLSTGISVIIMLYVATLILFFLGGLNAFVLVVADFHHAVLVNRIFGYKSPKTDMEALTLGKTRTLEEITSGLHAKFIWQSPTFIDLRRHSILGTSVTTYSYDQIEQVIKWDGIVGPIPGFLCNLVRNSPSAGHSIIQARTEGALSQIVNATEHEDLNQNMIDLKDAFKNLYGGDDTASEFEQSLGLGVRRLTIKEVNRNKSFQKSAELPERTRKTAMALEILLKAARARGVKLDPKSALQAIMAESGDGQLIMYQGLENVGGKVMLSIGQGKNKKDRREGGENE